jgi:hypothetical protein
MKIGKLYKVNHSRKGKFNVRVTSFDDTWVTGVVENSTAVVIMDYNIKESGDTISIRRSLATFQESEG